MSQSTIPAPFVPIITVTPHNIGGPNLSVFRTTKSKSRLNFLSLLRGNYQDYVLNGAAFEYLEEHNGGSSLIAGLKSLETQHFCNQVPFTTHLASKGVDIIDTQAVGILAEAGLWGQSAITA